MKHLARLGTVSLLLSALSATTAIAQTNSGGNNSWLPDIQPAHRYFMRLGWASLKMNNKSSAAYDTDGGVYSAGNRSYTCANAACTPSPNTTSYGSTIAPILFNNPGNPGVLLNGGVLGLPENVKARADDSGGAFGSVGVYLDDNQNWAVEALVLGLPFSSDIYGAGTFEGVGKIITTKFLPPSALVHYYFGKKDWKFRPSVSAAVNYTIFFDTKATQTLVDLTGGQTKVSLKNSLGFGLFIGGTYNIDERWSLNANVGQLKVKTTATITTYDTKLDADSRILTMYPGQLGANIQELADQNLLGTTLDRLQNYRNNRDQINGGANLGNFTRKQQQTLDPYVLFVSLGYNF